ncbi:glycosyl transferase [Proteus mirabilis]|uniref:Glycosyl transferase n=1 Tax=Proteus mirabilis TaxID=584 RepID=A0A379EZV3_PROMI|nr:glycosyl transferase [Proteus mirabilis]
MSKSVLSILHTESSCGWGGQEIRILTESQGMVAKRAPCDTGLLSKLKNCQSSPDYGIEVVTLPIEKNADLH